MSCHCCGPGAAERKMAKSLAEKMVKELTIKRRSDLGRKLGLKKQIELCCSGMRGYLERGWVKARPIEISTPDRIYFIVEIRGQETNMILHRCPMCGRVIYPAPDKQENPG